MKVLLWDVSQRFTYTPFHRFGVLSGTGTRQKGLTYFGLLFSPLLQVSPLIYPHFE